jgi:predicted  nucleic acid-binding Zn ribbon protein
MHSLSIQYDDTVDIQELWHVFYRLLNCLHSNGQLVGRDRHPYLTPNQMAATIYTVTTEALALQYRSMSVLKAIAELEAFCGYPLKIEYLGSSEDEETEICHCTQHDHYVLYGFHLFSPIRCGSCSLGVPLFRVPKIQDDSHYALLNWEGNYRACMTLDLNCTVGEEWAIAQQSNYDSELSKQGREIAAKLTQVSGVPTYYYLTNFSQRSADEDQSCPCPSCGGDWHLDQEIHGFFRYQCDKCLLMSSDASRL